MKNIDNKIVRAGKTDEETIIDFIPDVSIERVSKKKLTDNTMGSFEKVLMIALGCIAVESFVHILTSKKENESLVRQALGDILKNETKKSLK